MGKQIKNLSKRSGIIRDCYTGKAIRPNQEIILVENIVPYARKLGYIISNYRFLFLFMFLILVLNSVSALELNPFADRIVYEKTINEDLSSFIKDDFNSEYGVIKFSKTLFWIESDRIAEYSLIKNTNQCLSFCEAEGKAVLYSDSKLFDDLRFIDEFGSEKYLKNVKYLIKEIEFYETQFPDKYIDVCINSTKGVLNQSCSKEVSTYKTEINNRTVWNVYKGQILPKGNYEWKVQAEKDISQNIDFIPIVRNEMLSQWAWWNSSWTKNKELNITGGASALTNFTVFVNITYDADMNVDFSDIRFVNSTGSELKFDYDYGVNSSFIGVWIKFPNLATQINTIYMYYNNPTASNPKYGSETYPGRAYHFSETSGTLLTDSYQGKNMTYSGSPIINQSGAFGYAMQCDGSNDYAYNATSVSDLIFSNGARSVSYWTYILSNADDEYMLSYGTEGSTSQYFAPRFSYGLTNDLGFMGNGASSDFSTGVTLSNGQWYLLTYTYDGSNLAISYNGIIKSAVKTLSTVNFYPLYLCRRNSAGYYNGLMDEVRFATHVMSSSEINRTYQNRNMSYFTFGAETSGSSPDTNYPVFSSEQRTTNGTNYTSSNIYNFNITITSANGSAGLTFNNVNYSMTNVSTLFTKTLGNLSAGTYNYRYWAYGNGTSNLYNSTELYSLTITKAQGVIYTYLNNQRQNYSAYVNSNVLLNSTLINGTGTINLYLNGSLINTGNSPLSNTTQLYNVGVYPILSNYSGNANYTSSSESYNLSIIADDIYPTFINIQGPISGINYSSNANYIFNATLNNINGTAGFNFGGVNFSMSNVSTFFNKTLTDLTPGIYSYRFWAYGNGTSHLYNSTELYSLTITKAQGVIYTYINGLRSDRILSNISNILLNSTLINGTGTINLYLNGSLINTGSSPLSNTTQLPNLGIYTILSNYSGNANYTFSSESWFLESALVNVLTTTTVLTDPLGSAYNSSNTTFGCFNDYGLDTQMYINGFNKTDEKDVSILRAIGTYNINCSSNTISGYEGSSQLITYSITEYVETDSSMFEIDFNNFTAMIFFVLFLAVLLLMYLRHGVFAGSLLSLIGFVLLFSAFNPIIAIVIIFGGVLIIFATK